MKNKMIQPENIKRKFLSVFFKDDTPLEQSRKTKKNKRSDKQGKKKKPKDFGEYYY